MIKNPTLNAIIRECLPDYLFSHPTLNSNYRHVLNQLRVCRQPENGLVAYQCEDCGTTVFAYDTCGSRYCPSCQSSERVKWVKKQLASVLDTVYFHVVFTVPSELYSVSLRNKGEFLKLLFKNVSETLKKVCKKKLKGKVGFTCVLHTWTKDLRWHPHIHVIIPGGAVSDDEKWIPSAQNYLVPVDTLRGKFRALMMEDLKGNLITDKELINKLYSMNWIVYAKSSFNGSPDSIIEYLARYSYSTAISNSRILSLSDDNVVTFKFYNRKTEQTELAHLDADEFITRFTYHILPPKFQRIRHYGYLSSRNKTENIKKIRIMIEEYNKSKGIESVPTPPKTNGDDFSSLKMESIIGCCPYCGSTSMTRINDKFYAAYKYLCLKSTDPSKIVWLSDLQAARVSLSTG
jgi:hypothetical protein